jgi:hypothetical protein
MYLKYLNLKYCHGTLKNYFVTISYLLFVLNICLLRFTHYKHIIIAMLLPKCITLRRVSVVGARVFLSSVYDNFILGHTGV